jgi:hypothetical protein
VQKSACGSNNRESAGQVRDQGWGERFDDFWWREAEVCGLILIFQLRSGTELINFRLFFLVGSLSPVYCSKTLQSSSSMKRSVAVPLCFHNSPSYGS